MSEPKFDPARFRRLRESRFTPTELAFHLGRSYRAVMSWEEGVSVPPARVLVKAAGLLGCQVEEFFVFTDHEALAQSG